MKVSGRRSNRKLFFFKRTAPHQHYVLFPQVLINVRFAGGDNPLESEAVKAVAADVEKRLEGKGRILLRKSGTEPLIRVMVECEDGVLAKQCAEEIAEAVKAN